MTEHKQQEGTVLYEKVGRRYRVWGNTRDHRFHGDDVMKVGTFRLTYCPAPGHYRYSHGVTPDKEAFVAAAEVARHAMEEAMRDAAISTPRPQEGREYTPEQQAIVEQFRKDMAAAGALVPEWWVGVTAYEIAQAGIDAVLNHKIPGNEVDS